MGDFMMSKTLDFNSPHGYTYLGLPARILEVHAKGEFPIIALVGVDDGGEFLMGFSPGRAPATATNKLEILCNRVKMLAPLPDSDGV